MDRNRNGGEGWTVPRVACAHLTGRVEGPRLGAQLKDANGKLDQSTFGGGATCFNLSSGTSTLPGQPDEKARWLWEALLTAQRASAEAPFPQPNDAVCPVPVHRPRATSRQRTLGLLSARAPTAMAVSRKKRK